MPGAAFVIVVGYDASQAYSKMPMYRSSARVLIQDERSMAVGNLNANDPMFWQDRSSTTTPNTASSAAAAWRGGSFARLQLQNHPLFNGSAPQGGPATPCARAAKDHWGGDGSHPGTRVPDRPPMPGAEDAAESRRSASSWRRAIIPEKSTRLVEIVYDSPDPEFAALAATALAEEYTQQNLDLRLETIQKNLVWLSDEVGKQEKKVNEAEAAMSKYREEQNALSLEDRQNIVARALNTLNETVTRARTERMQKEATYNQVKSVDPKTDAADAFPVIATNPGVMETKTRLNDLIAEKARLSSIPAGTSGHQSRNADQERAETLIASARASSRRSGTSTKPRSIEERSFAGQLE